MLKPLQQYLPIFQPPEIDGFPYSQSLLINLDTGVAVNRGKRVYSKNGSERNRQSTFYKGKRLSVSRIILLWLNAHGAKIPVSLVVDHIDNDPLNDALDNLRAITVSHNNLRKSIQKNNTSGICGYAFRSDMGRRKHCIQYFWKGKNYYRYFRSKEDAAIYSDNRFVRVEKLIDRYSIYFSDVYDQLLAKGKIHQSECFNPDEHRLIK